MDHAAVIKGLPCHGKSGEGRPVSHEHAVIDHVCLEEQNKKEGKECSGEKTYKPLIQGAIYHGDKASGQESEDQRVYDIMAGRSDNVDMEYQFLETQGQGEK